MSRKPCCMFIGQPHPHDDYHITYFISVTIWKSHLCVAMTLNSPHDICVGSAANSVSQLSLWKSREKVVRWRDSQWMARQPFFTAVCSVQIRPLPGCILNEEGPHQTHTHTHVVAHIWSWKDIGHDPELHPSQMNSCCSGATGMNCKLLFRHLCFQRKPGPHSPCSLETLHFSVHSTMQTQVPVYKSAWSQG